VSLSSSTSLLHETASTSGSAAVRHHDVPLPLRDQPHRGRSSAIHETLGLLRAERPSLDLRMPRSMLSVLQEMKSGSPLAGFDYPR